MKNLSVFLMFITPEGSTLTVFENETGYYMSDESVKWDRVLFGEKSRVSREDVREYARNTVLGHPLAFDLIFDADWREAYDVPTKHLVLNENTLCYAIDGLKGSLGVLAGSVIRGGHNPLNGTVAYHPGIDQVRPATIADFVEYRVSPKGHLRDEVGALPMLEVSYG